MEKILIEFINTLDSSFKKIQAEAGSASGIAQLTLIACSNYVFNRPQDWSNNVHNTGYWFLDEDDWIPPEELQKFLQAGKPPVYVGFGSLGNPDEATQTTELIVDALERSGQRGILATG